MLSELKSFKGCTLRVLKFTSVFTDVSSQLLLEAQNNELEFVLYLAKEFCVYLYFSRRKRLSSLFANIAPKKKNEVVEKRGKSKILQN